MKIKVTEYRIVQGWRRAKDSERIGIYLLDVGRVESIDDTEVFYKDFSPRVFYQIHFDGHGDDYISSIYIDGKDYLKLMKALKASNIE